VKKTWEARWERYFLALKQSKVEPVFHEFYWGGSGFFEGYQAQALEGS
jgi:hypothetical protein